MHTFKHVRASQTNGNKGELQNVSSLAGKNLQSVSAASRSAVSFFFFFINQQQHTQSRLCLRLQIGLTLHSAMQRLGLET